MHLSISNINENNQIIHSFVRPSIDHRRPSSFSKLFILKLYQPLNHNNDSHKIKTHATCK